MNGISYSIVVSYSLMMPLPADNELMDDIWFISEYKKIIVVSSFCKDLWMHVIQTFDQVQMVCYINELHVLWGEKWQIMIKAVEHKEGAFPKPIFFHEFRFRR